jgi:thiol-disulfide isomerase/thioredoxin
MKLHKTLVFAAVMLAPYLVSAQTPAAGARTHAAAGPQWLAPDAAAEKALNDGLAEAKSSHKRLAVLYEGSWCTLCDGVHEAIHSDPDLPRLLAGYVGVPIQVADAAAVQQFAQKIHANLPKDNAMLITVLDSDGALVTTITAPRILEAGHVSQARLKAILMEFFPGAPANEVLAGSLAALAANGKLGWVEFRADWCGWCHKMEKLFQESEAAPILAKYYSVVTVDTEKNDGSDQLARRLGSVNGVNEIPWFAAIDQQGKVLATSEGPKGNIGFPDTDVEVAHFFAVLHATAKGITAGEIETIARALKAK